MFPRDAITTSAFVTETGNIDLGGRPVTILQANGRFVGKPDNREADFAVWCEGEEWILLQAWLQVYDGAGVHTNDQKDEWWGQQTCASGNLIVAMGNMYPSSITVTYIPHSTKDQASAFSGSINYADWTIGMAVMILLMSCIALGHILRLWKGKKLTRA